MKHYKKILAIDVGGTGLKLAVIDPRGDLISDHLHVPTPHPVAAGQGRETPDRQRQNS